MLAVAEPPDRRIPVLRELWQYVQVADEEPEADPVLAFLESPGLAVDGREALRISDELRHDVLGRLPAGLVSGMRDAFAGYWLGQIPRMDEAPDVIRRSVPSAVLRAAPYLQAEGRWEVLSDYLQLLQAIDHSPPIVAAMLPFQQVLAEATGSASDLAQLGRSMSLKDPQTGAAILRRAYELHREQGAHTEAFILVLNLTAALMQSARLGMAVALNQEAQELAAEGGLGPGSELAAKVQELQLRAMLGQQVLDEALALRPRVAELLEHPSEVIPVHDTSDLLHDVIVSAANDKRDWGTALDELEAQVQRLTDRAASAHEIAMANFRRYVPLKEIGNLDGAETVLLHCREVFEDVGDIGHLASTYGALGRVAIARGNTERAVELQRTTLRLAYTAPHLHTIATAHRHFAAYLPTNAAATRWAHGVAAASLHRFAANDDLDETLRELVAMQPAPAWIDALTVAELEAELRRSSGTSPLDLASTFGLDERTLASLVAEIAAVLRGGQPAEGRSWSEAGFEIKMIRRWEAAIAAIVAVSQGDEAARPSLERYLDLREQSPDWQELVPALRRVADGERDRSALCPGLDNLDRAIVTHTLSALAGEVQLQQSLADLPTAHQTAEQLRNDFIEGVADAVRGQPNALEQIRLWPTAPGPSGAMRTGVILHRIVDGVRPPDPLFDALTPAQHKLVDAILDRLAGLEAEEPDEHEMFTRRLARDLEDGNGPEREDIQSILFDWRNIDEALANVAEAVERRLAAGQVSIVVRLMQTLAVSLVDRHDRRRALDLVERLAALVQDHGATIEPLFPAIVAEAALQAVQDASFDGHLRSLGSATPQNTPAPRGFRGDKATRDRADRWVAAAMTLTADQPADMTVGLRLAYAISRLGSGNVDRAIELAERLLGESLGNPAVSRAARLMLASAYERKGNLAEALRCFEDLIAEAPDAVGLSMAGLHQRYARVLGKLGRDHRALAALQRALAAVPDGNDTELALKRTAIRSAIGDVYERLGDIGAAIRAHLTAFAVARRTGHRVGQAIELHALGNIFGKMHTTQLGWLADDDFVELLTALPHVNARLGRLPLDAGTQGVAMVLLDEAMALFRQLDEPTLWASAANDLTNLMDDDEDALALLREALEIKQTHGDSPQQAVTLANIAGKLEAVGRLDEAAETWRRSRDIARTAGYFESSVTSATSLGRLLLTTGDSAGAEAAFEDAVRMIETVRPERPFTDGARVAFAHRHHGAYSGLVHCLIERGADTEAYQMVQRAKSRALLDLSGLGTIVPTADATGRFGELLKEEAELLGSLQRQTSAEFAVSTADRLRAVHDAMEPYDSEYAAMRRGSPATVNDLLGWLRRQRRSTLLVEYFVTATSVTLFMLRAEWESVRTHRAAVTNDELHQMFADFQREVVAYRNLGGVRWLGISQHLVEPIRPYLRRDDLVYLVPHRVLHAIPMHALYLDGRPLAAAHPVAYVPAAGLLPLCQNPAKGTGQLNSCAAVGVDFIAEAEDIARLFDGECLVSENLTVTDVAQHADGRDILHLSSHARFDSRDPLASGLRLSPSEAPDGEVRLMTARDIAATQFGNELITVSACETAMQEVRNGDELIGLVRALLHAGSPSVVASLWPVDAASTHEFMLAFYTELRTTWSRTGTIDKAGALREAQMSVMRTKGERASFHWAPFVLIGDWC